MVYIRLYEEFSVIKDYVLEFVFDGVYRIYGVKPEILNSDYYSILVRVKNTQDGVRIFIYDGLGKSFREYFDHVLSKYIENKKVISKLQSDVQTNLAGFITYKIKHATDLLDIKFKNSDYEVFSSAKKYNL